MLVQLDTYLRPQLCQWCQHCCWMHQDADQWFDFSGLQFVSNQIINFVVNTLKASNAWFVSIIQKTEATPLLPVMCSSLRHLIFKCMQIGIAGLCGIQGASAWSSLQVSWLPRTSACLLLCVLLQVQNLWGGNARVQLKTSCGNWTWVQSARNCF